MWLHRYAKLVSAATVLLIVAGGLVTSTGSGLAVPDWPTSYGWNMFTFPMKHMVGGIFYEHGHRLIASGVGFLTIILAFWIWKAEPRRWMRVIGFTALAAVCVQGLLGGITVLYFLPTPVSTAHAGLAQIFFCLTVAIALFTSKGWTQPTYEPVDDRMLRLVATTTTAFIYLQIIVGATMRHSDAGLAIPDFPLVFGGLFPPVWTPQIAVHYAHRIGALIVTLAIAATVSHVWYHHSRRSELRGPALTLACLVLAQVTLGAFVVWSQKNVAINTAHVVVGALTLATSLVLTLAIAPHPIWRRRRRRARPPASRAAPRPIGCPRVKNVDAGVPDHSIDLSAPVAHRAADFLALTKPRLNSLVVVTAGIGYYLGAAGNVHVASLVQAVIGIALVAGGAAGLNQIYERDTDSLMFRTRMRPLAAQRVTTSEALMFSLALVVIGLGILADRVKSPGRVPRPADASCPYNVIYTPMKRRSQLATLVGAVPGALPPMIGWVAARGALTLEAWALFAIVFVWQIPHFMAIAWLYRADFSRAGFPLLPVVEPTGRSTARQAVLFSLVLVPLSLAPYFLKMSGPAYAAGAAAGSVALLWLAISFALKRTDDRARLLFLGSITYLPLLWGMLILDRL